MTLSKTLEAARDLARSNMDNSIKVTIELNQEDAWSFAQVLKRAGIDDYKRLSKTEEEAYQAMSAADKIREALSQSGVNPR